MTESATPLRRWVMPFAATFLAVVAVWAATAMGQPLPLAAFLVPVFAAVLLSRPQAIALVMLTVGVLGKAFNSDFALPLGALRLTPFQVLAFAFLAWGLTRWALGARGGTDPWLRRTLILLMLAILSGLLTAIIRSPGSFTGAQLDARALLPYCAALPLLVVFREREAVEKLEAWLIRFVALLSAVALAGAFVPLGPVLSLNGLLSAAGDEVSTLGTLTTGTRVRPELLNVVVVLVFLVLAGTNRRLGRSWRIFAALAFVGLLLVSYTRSTWIAVLVALVVWWRAQPAQGKLLARAATAAVVAVVALLAFGLASSGRFGPEGSSLVTRITSIGNSEVRQEVSYTDRVDENTVAWQTLKKSPVFGVGLGEPYGAMVRVRDPLSGRALYIPRSFIHNQYLFIWLRMGLLGLAVFAGLAYWIVRAAVRARTRLGTEAGRVLAPACGMLALGIQAIFQTSLLKPSVATATILSLVLMHQALQEDRT